ncbi:MAG TPA: hypothetical protein VGX69_04980 [Solirubrobacteraceae bacterium]|jgi:hypothetical protein|nr:hypothetical protein [Solirubrobacteraceae bacterium]
MTRTIFAPRALAAGALLFPALALAPLGAAALAVRPRPPSPSKLAPAVVTGAVSNARATSAILQGSVNPHGVETSYYFQYGPTLAYGHQTSPTSVGKGATVVKVGQTVSSFLDGYHYRIVATNVDGLTKVGRDRVYTASTAKLRFALASTKETAPTPYGGTFVLRGTLAGAGGALRTITAQSSPFPYLTAFTQLGVPLLTNAAGAFVVNVKDLKQNTQLRVIASGPKPLLSAIVTARVSVRVTLKVRSSARKGLVRLYGTVTPAQVGARVLFQLEKATRPHGKSERETSFVTQGSGVVKHGTRTVSRFSQILAIRKSGHYRAYVLLGPGPLVSGESPTVTLHAGPKRR